jgi:hypothetical protein
VLTPEEKRGKHAEYMREYTRKNAARINAQRRERATDPARKANKSAQDATYRAKTVSKRQTPEARAAAATNAKHWRERHPEAYRESKRRYYASNKGKACKKREDTAFVVTGGRAIAEQKRASKPLTEPRKQARLRYQLARRVGETALSELDAFVLHEAVALARLRNKGCFGKWHVDHILPVSRGGTSAYDNLQVVPAFWNQSKSNRHNGKFFPA